MIPAVSRSVPVRAGAPLEAVCRSQRLMSFLRQHWPPRGYCDYRCSAWFMTRRRILDSGSCSIILLSDIDRVTILFTVGLGPTRLIRR
jgi:hypothetical protein